MIRFDLQSQLPSILRLRNPNRYLIEGWVFGTARTRAVRVRVGDTWFSTDDLEIYRPDVGGAFIGDDPDLYALFSGFSIPVVIRPVRVSVVHAVTFETEFTNGETFTHRLGDVTLEPWEPATPVGRFLIHGDPDDRVAVCMATYNPTEVQFRRQVQSLIEQRHANWICVVSDDGSDGSCKSYMKAILAQDPRFFLIEHPDRVGFYHNFERCLERVPPEARYVALADQDDRWYPDKLSTCLAAFRDELQLVYCDMKIVTDDGRVISETYWKERKNYYRIEDLDLLSIANTVTGAASVFRAGLLETILPFPPRYGNVFHDHWVALMAAASGGIGYVDRPLYEYIQSGNNIIGHVNFGHRSVRSFVASLYNAAPSQQLDGLPLRVRWRARTIARIKRYLVPLRKLCLLKHMEGGGKAFWTIIETASIRGLDPRFTATIRRSLTVLGLLKLRAKIWWRRETTNDIELWILGALASNALYKLGVDALRRLLRRRRALGASLGIPTVDGEIVEYKRKFSGRDFVLVDRPPRVNMLLSCVDPANLFGGYMGMFNFAKRFSERGHPIRFVLTDQRDIDEDALRKVQNHDPQLKGFLERAEYVACFSGPQPVPISSTDVCIATSWWTAYLANEAIAKTVYKKFIFLIQEYEPIFYEHDSLRVLAERSYRLNYFPFFSTDILRKHFIDSGYLTPDKPSEWFRNPILEFNLDRNWMAARRRARKKRILFYARPQPHASRNLYLLGCLALDRARDMGAFPDHEWEVIGIGWHLAAQILPSGLRIRHIGRFDMEAYASMLPDHDLGLALMYSPHPSLLPIEMASAGLLVVTNTYGIKDQQYFSSISSNILAVPADDLMLAEALIDQSKRVDDLDARLRGSRVQWPHRWDEALPERAIDHAFESVIRSASR